MTCPRHDDLSAYADDMVQPAERVRMRQHLAGCPACQHRLDAITALGQSLRALPSPPLGVDLAGQWNEPLPEPPPGPLRTPPQGRRPARPDAGRSGRAVWSNWLGWMPAGLASGLALASGVWLGGLLLGLIELMTIAFLPELTGYKDAFAFILLIVVLLVKPTGLLGSKQGEKV